MGRKTDDFDYNVTAQDNNADCLNNQDQKTEEPDKQDAAYKILAMVDKIRQEDIFGDHHSESDQPEEELLFSKNFMDKMHHAVEEQFGKENADNFITVNAHLFEKENNESRDVAITDINEKTVEKNMSLSSAEPEEEDSTTTSAPCAKKDKHHFSFKNMLSTWPRRVAAAAVLTIAIGLAYEGTVQAFKLPGVKVHMKDRGNSSKVSSLKDIITSMGDTDYPKTLEKVYVPSVIADGYEEVDREIGSKYCIVYYKNKENVQYCFYQYTVETTVSLDTELDKGINVQIVEKPGILVLGEKGNHLWWFNLDYVYKIEGDLSEDTMVSIAESLYAIQ